MSANKNDSKQNKRDVQVTNCGTIFQFFLLTKAAKEWVAENCSTEGYQWMGDALCVEHRYARDIANGMIGDGLKVA